MASRIPLPHNFQFDVESEAARVQLCIESTRELGHVQVIDMVEIRAFHWLLIVFRARDQQRLQFVCSVNRMRRLKSTFGRDDAN